MKFCGTHWEALREAIRARELDHLIARDGERAVENLVSELETGRSIANFDPLMGAQHAIVGNALDWVGLTLLFPDENGDDRCPLCFMTESHAANCTQPDCDIKNYDVWIEHAADDMVTAWKKMSEDT